MRPERVGSIILCLFVWVLCSVAVGQTTYTVGTVGADYATIAAAEAVCVDGDSIEVLDAVHTESNIVVDVSITIKGQGANQTIVEAATNKWSLSGRIIAISGSGRNVMVQDLTFRHGDYYRVGSGDVAGGAIHTGDNNLTVERCMFVDNRAQESSWVWHNCFGGAIYGSGDTYLIKDSTFQGNLARASTGGQLARGGALYLGSADVTIQNCTFSGNTAYSQGNGGGGGAVMVTPGAGQTSLVYNTTFVSNSIRAPWAYGGGAYAGGATNRSTVYSCLFADNTHTAATGGDAGSAMTRTSFTNCIYEGTLYVVTDLGGSSQTADAGVDVLADNGGGTLTHALLEGSPALDAGSNPAGLSYDQRGSGYRRWGRPSTDCGSFELQPPLAGTVFRFY